MKSNDDRNPIGAAVGSGITGAFYGLILFLIATRLVEVRELAMLLAASAVAFSVSLFSRLQRTYAGDHKPRLLLPALHGAICGSAVGICIIWFAPAAWWFFTYLLFGAIAGAVTSFTAEVLPQGVK